MNPARQVLRHIDFAFDECAVDNQLRRFVGETRLLPCLDLLPHGFEVPLHAVHADREDVHKVDAFRMLREYRREITLKRHVVAHKHAVAHGESQSHGLVVGIPNADREAASVEGCFKIQDAEHLHAVAGNRIFLPHN